ncbi:MAG: hypothetical protein MUO64_02320 [Anaerolineales bacterium]|nr:hypothetical protein [Anaerolineales bacterium]
MLFISASLGFLVLAGLFIVAFVYYRAQGIKAIQYEPPVVIITAPESMLEMPAGDKTSVVAMATGQNPILRLELWADGTLVEPLERIDAEENQPFYGYFTYTVSEGVQILFVRAVNAAGIIGQSQPIGVTGVTKQDLSQSLYLVPLEEGNTMENVASEYNVPLPDLQAANPGLGIQPPAPGTMLQVPVAPQNEPPAQPPAQLPGQPPAPPQVQPPAQVGNNLPLLPTNPVVGLASNLVLFAGGLDSPPSAPTDLKVTQYGVVGCEMFMTWQDNATNEQRYEIWMATPDMKSIATLKAGPGTGIVWFKSFVPSHAKMVFWVEAINLYGKSISKLVPLVNDDSCKIGYTKFGTHLLFIMQSLGVKGNYDRFYCYFSAGKVPEIRIPNDDNTFIELKNGAWFGSPKGKTNFIAPIPESGVLDIKGECLGWAGNALSKLGPFNAQYKLGDMQSYGVDSQLTVKTANYEFHFHVGWPLASGNPLDQTAGLPYAFGFSDPALTKPYNLQISTPKGIYPPGDMSWKLERYLEWKWDGDENKINSFTILRNGSPILAKPVPANARQATVLLPAQCDERVRWEVAAISDTGMALSAPFEHDLPKCEYTLLVQFTNIWFNWVFDERNCFLCNKPTGCNHQAEGYFELSVNDEQRNFYAYGSNLYVPFKGCTGYDLVALTEWYKPLYPEPTLFKVPFPDKDQDKDQIIYVSVHARFLDDDDKPNPNDVLVSFYNPGIGGSYQDLAKDLPEGSQKCYEIEDACNKYDDGCGTLQYCLSLEVKPIGP